MEYWALVKDIGGCKGSIAFYGNLNFYLDHLDPMPPTCISIFAHTPFCQFHIFHARLVYTHLNGIALLNVKVQMLGLLRYHHFHSCEFCVVTKAYMEHSNNIMECTFTLILHNEFKQVTFIKDFRH